MVAEADAPREFTADDYASRMARVVDQALEAGLDGVVVAPGPDLVWLTGYQPTAITERLTHAGPLPRRPADPAGAGAGAARRRGGRRSGGRRDARLGRRRRPVRRRRRRCCSRTAGSGSPTRHGRPTCSASSAALPGSRFQALGEGLPMMRAVKGANELERLAAAGAAADATYLEIVELPFAGRLRDGGCRRPGPAAARARSRAGRLHRGRLGSQRRQPAPRGR